MVVETTEESGGRSPLNVEQNVSFAKGHSLRVWRLNGWVVEVIPVTVLRHEGRVVTRTGPINMIGKQSDIKNISIKTWIAEIIPKS